MNYKEIRKMSDKELNSFLSSIQNDSRRICCKCGEFILNKVVINVRKGQMTRTLCTLCEDCYSSILDYIGINDAKF